MNNNDKKTSCVPTKVLEVNPDTEYTLQVLERTIERIRSRKEDPNAVYNVLRDAMGELIPYPTGEMFEKYQLTNFEPGQNDYMPSEEWLLAHRLVDEAVDELKARGVPLSDIQDALFDRFIRTFLANPWRDPVDVEAVEQDYFHAYHAIDRLERMMESLYKALNRAAKQRDQDD